MTLPTFSIIIVVIILAFSAFLSVKSNKLTAMAGLCAFLVGIGIYSGGDITGLVMLAAFFVMATMATAHKKQEKAKLESKTRHQERRKPGQVFANGGIAAILGLLAFLFPAHDTLLNIMLASAISAATADTLASELGMVYGRNAINILSFKKESRGLDGVISIEGTLLGIAGSAIIALIYHAFTGADLKFLIIIVIAGTCGNLIDSLLGALLERKHMVNNDTVNLLNTLAGALVAMVLFLLL